MARKTTMITAFYDDIKLFMSTNQLPSLVITKQSVLRTVNIPLVPLVRLLTIIDQMENKICFRNAAHSVSSSNVNLN